MGYISLQSNQAVTAANIQDAIDIGLFTAASVFSISNKCITKNEALTYVNLDTSFAPFAAKTSNQLVVKSNLKPTFQNSATLYYSSLKIRWEGWTSTNNACANYSSGLSSTVYFNGSLSAGTLLFIANPVFDSSGSSAFYFAINYLGTIYWITFNNYNYYDANAGYATPVASIGTCVSGTPWTARYSTNFSDVCLQIDQTVYTSTGTFTTGDTVYTDAFLSTPLVGYNYISESLSGTIWNIDSGTGVIGSSTFTSC